MITTKVLSLETWGDLENLFGKSGAFWGCWCCYWRLSNKDFSKMSSEDRKNYLFQFIKDQKSPLGLLGYLDGKPVAWIGFSPRDSFIRLINSRVFSLEEGENIHSIVCFFIHKKYRGMGLTAELIQGTITYAKSNGISIIEAYPIEFNGKERIDVNGSYCGISKQFEEKGFIKEGETMAKSAGIPRIIMKYFVED